MKHTLPIILGTTLLLAACGGSSAEVACDQQYWDGTVGTCLPQGWSVIDRATLVERGLPQEVTVGFQAATAVSGQFPTVAVTTETLADPIDAAAYSEASIRSVTVLPKYTLVDTRPVTVEGQEVQIHIFTAQPVAEEPERRFHQVSTVHGNNGYTFTALTPVSVDSDLEEQVLLILEHMTFTEPVAEEAAE
ncbi:MAG: hypothetical protein Q7R81_04730 [Candidatus Peregrinibacteria bacterium]|nr:hypothetical protein [Candidatus Peregrinibacteria bacterium]